MYASVHIWGDITAEGGTGIYFLIHLLQHFLNKSTFRTDSSGLFFLNFGTLA